MTAPAVDLLLYLLDEAFAGDGWHSLLSNLRDTTPAEWRWTPPGGRRSICDVVRHVGGCKFMYETRLARGGGTHSSSVGGRLVGPPG